MAIVVFVPATFKAAYPEFANVLDARLQVMFSIAEQSLLDNTSGSPVMDLNYRTQLFYMLVAHLVTTFGAAPATPNNRPPGRLSSATEGTVSSSFEYIIPVGSAMAAWYMQTPYGALYWTVTAQFRSMQYYAIGDSGVGCARAFLAPPLPGVNTGGGSGPSPTPPINLALPVTTGTAQVGQLLSLSNGTWANSPDSFTYEWFADGIAIAGETNPELLVTIDDLGAVITGAVTATNTYGSASATSLPTAPVAGLAPGPVTNLQPGVATSNAQPLTWNASATGTAPITYQVAYRLGTSSGAYTDFGSPISGTASTVTGLLSNTAYDYQVTPLNVVGAGTPGLLNDASTAPPDGGMLLGSDSLLLGSDFLVLA